MGGITNEADMHQWLQPRSNSQKVYLAGSAHSTIRDYMPVYTLIGDSIRYENEGWSVAPKLVADDYALDHLLQITIEDRGGANPNPSFSEIDESVHLIDLKFTDKTFTELD